MISDFNIFMVTLMLIKNFQTKKYQGYKRNMEMKLIIVDVDNFKLKGETVKYA